MIASGLQGSNRGGSPEMVSPTVLGRSFSELPRSNSTNGLTPSPKMRDENWKQFRSTIDLSELEQSFRSEMPVDPKIQQFYRTIVAIRQENKTSLNNCPEIFQTLFQALVSEQKETEEKMWDKFMKFFKDPKKQEEIQKLNRRA